MPTQAGYDSQLRLSTLFPSADATRGQLYAQFTLGVTDSVGNFVGNFPLSDLDDASNHTGRYSGELQLNTSGAYKMTLSSVPCDLDYASFLALARF